MKIASWRVYCFFALLVILACCKNPHKQNTANTLFTLLDNSGINFENTITNTREFNIFKYRNFYNGAGVAIGDINNDGLSDVFFTANMSSNKLYLNKGNLQFDDVSEKAGFTAKPDWSTGVVMADVNNDGWLDIYVCNAGFINGQAPSNQLFINNHNLTFTESAKSYGLTNNGGYCTHAAFFDFDLDGDLDCYILNNSFIPVNTLNYANKRDMRAKDWPVADFLKGGGDKLLRNDNGKFNDVSEEAHIYGSLIGFGLGVTVGDVNNDRYPDIYVSNDFFERDYLYLNQRDGTFTEALEKNIQHTSHSSMGADMADLNNDGHPEILVTEMLPGDETRFKTTASFENIDIQKLKERSGFYHQYMQNTLQYNNGDGTFSETAFYSGVAATDWSWGGLLFDADNDGLNDLYVCNGIYNDLTDQDFIDFFANDIIQKMALTGKKEDIDEIISKMPSVPIPNRAFRNAGNMKFKDAGEAWGIDIPSLSNGAAYGDLDNDGDLDIVVNNVNSKCFVLRNNAAQPGRNNFIGFNLHQQSENRFAVGALVKVYSNKQVLSKELIPARGFQSSMDYKIVIGLGKNTVDSAVIVWPDKTYQTIISPGINTFHSVDKLADLPVYHPAINIVKPYLAPLTAAVFDKHTEDDYTDFYYERNIPELLSTEGPGATVADVNGDGLEDVYVCGAAGQAGQLYLQSNKGFVKSQQPIFSQFADFEDVTALFFDCDSDGDKDLIVGSGGNNRLPGAREMLNRLYKNDGKGNFSIALNAFDYEKGMNTAVIAANDFDNDGDIDLFIGSRSTPMNYGVSPVSYLYQNDGSGHFSDIAHIKNKDFANIGMVTGAVWCDINGDKQKELVIAGEWMAPKVFACNKDHFEELQAGLNNLHGWWQTVTATDIDFDGDNDLVLGNIGENFFLQPSATQPVKLWLGDFDDNKVPDKIITRSVAGNDMPVFLKRDLTDQLPDLKKQNLRHAEYASKSIQDLVGTSELSKGEVKLFNYASSVIAVNDGKGTFTIRKLPATAQLSSVNVVVPADINGDGIKDLLIGGNRFGFLPQFCRVDASYGTVLLNDGKGNLLAATKQESGLSVRGEIKDIKILDRDGIQSFLFLQNNEQPVLYKPTHNTTAKKQQRK